VGEIDILVNNAGITRDGMFQKMTKRGLHAVIETNLNSLFHVTKQVIDGMLARGWGRDRQHFLGDPARQFGQTNYSTVKAGIHGFTMALAQEVAAARRDRQHRIARIHRHRHGTGHQNPTGSRR